MSSNSLPKPIYKPNLERMIAKYEKEQDEVVTISDAFDAHCKNAWDLSKVTSKELLALHANLSKRTGNESFILLHIHKI